MAQKRALEGAVLVALVAVFVFLVTWNLDALPGLHGDEAWFGLRAKGILDGEGGSIHGMNAYTGAVFPWVVAGAFRIFGVSVLTLRGLGVAMNLGTLALFLGVAWMVGRRRGYAALLVFLLASLLCTTKARVAWDVTSLAPLLMAAAVFAAVLWLRGGFAGGARATVRAAVLLFAIVLGVYNHVIFLAFAVGLFAAIALVVLRPGPAPARRASTQLLLVQSAAIASAVALLVAKMLVYGSGADSPSAPVVAVAIVALEAIALGRAVSSPRVTDAVERFVLRFRKRLRIVLLAALAVGGVLFVVCHGLAFVMTSANDVLVKRLFSVGMPGPLVVFSFAAAVGLLVLLGRGLYLALRERAEMADEHFLLLALPLGVFAALPVLVMSNACRFYVLPNFALLLGAWAAWRLLPPRAGRAVMGVAVAYVVPLQIVLAGILGDREHYADARPIQFKLGTKEETSAHFLSTLATHERLRRDGASFVTAERFFLKLPLDFYAAAEGAPVPAEGRTATVNYDPATPGGVSYTLEEP